MSSAPCPPVEPPSEHGTPQGGTAATNRPRRSPKPVRQLVADDDGESPPASRKRKAPSPGRGRRRGRGGRGRGRPRTLPAAYGPCIAASCGRAGVGHHPLMPLPLCDDHVRAHAYRAEHGWPLGADGTEDVCRWCCGLDLDAATTGEARHEVTTLLCDACGKAWCESCLRSGLGGGFVDALLQPEEEEWRCLVCDQQLMGKAIALARPAAASAEARAAAAAVEAARAAAAARAEAKAAREAAAAARGAREDLEDEIVYLSDSAVGEASGEEDGSATLSASDEDDGEEEEEGEGSGEGSEEGSEEADGGRRARGWNGESSEEGGGRRGRGRSRGGAQRGRGAGRGALGGGLVRCREIGRVVKHRARSHAYFWDSAEVPVLEQPLQPALPWMMPRGRDVRVERGEEEGVGQGVTGQCGAARGAAPPVASLRVRVQTQPSSAPGRPISLAPGQSVTVEASLGRSKLIANIGAPVWALAWLPEGAGPLQENPAGALQENSVGPLQENSAGANSLQENSGGARQENVPLVAVGTHRLGAGQAVQEKGRNEIGLWVVEEGRGEEREGEEGGEEVSRREGGEASGEGGGQGSREGGGEGSRGGEGERSREGGVEVRNGGGGEGITEGGLEGSGEGGGEESIEVRGEGSRREEGESSSGGRGRGGGKRTRGRGRKWLNMLPESGAGGRGVGLGRLRLVASLVHDGGGVLDLCWCPKGNAVIPTVQDTGACGVSGVQGTRGLPGASGPSGVSGAPGVLGRLGLLAAACADGAVRVFAVPKIEELQAIAAAHAPPSVPRSSCSVAPSRPPAPMTFHLPPSVLLRPTGVCLALCLGWQPADPFHLLAVGRADGTVQLWNLRAAKDTGGGGGRVPVGGGGVPEGGRERTDGGAAEGGVPAGAIRAGGAGGGILSVYGGPAAAIPAGDAGAAPAIPAVGPAPPGVHVLSSPHIVLGQAVRPSGMRPGELGDASELRTDMTTRGGHFGPVRCVRWSPPPHSLLATGGHDGMWCVWECNQGWAPRQRRHATVGWVLDLLWIRGGNPSAEVGAPPGGPALIVSRDATEISIDPLFRPDPAQGFQLHCSPLVAVWSLGISASGDRLAAASSDGRLGVLAEKSRNASTILLQQAIVQLEDVVGGGGGGAQGGGGGGQGRRGGGQSARGGREGGGRGEGGEGEGAGDVGERVSGEAEGGEAGGGNGKGGPAGEEEDGAGGAGASSGHGGGGGSGNAAGGGTGGHGGGGSGDGGGSSREVGRGGGAGGGNGGSGGGADLLLVLLGPAAEASSIPDAPAGRMQRASLRKMCWCPNREHPNLLATGGNAGLLVCMEAPPAKQLG